MQRKASLVITMVTTILLGMLTIGNSLGFAQGGKPTSPETKTRMIQLINTLEKEPFHKEAKAYNKEVLVWLIEAPDVTITLCTDVVGGIKKFKGDEGSSLVAHLTFAEARFILQNPDKSSDKLAVNVAGVEGVIAMYQSMKTTKPKLKIDPMEKLILLQSEGKLTSFVEESLKNCK